jgi:hypothetical protein
MSTSLGQDWMQFCGYTEELRADKPNKHIRAWEKNNNRIKWRKDNKM